MTIWLVLRGSTYEGNFYESVHSVWKDRESAIAEALVRNTENPESSWRIEDWLVG